MDQPRWLEFAWGDLGVAEAAGAKSNPNVVRYYAEVGHAAVTDDEVAWCAAFLGACLERAGIRSTRSLMARSYLSWGEALSEPRQGAIAVLSRGFDPRLGHVGFLVGATSSDVILLGGNQGDAVRVQPFPRSRLVGLRWPADQLARPSPTPVIPEAEGHPPEAIRDPATADPLFEQALAHVLEMEGGYDDDPYDPGGPTNLGITLADYARYKGVEITADNIGALKGELKQIPVAAARQIYHERYWLPAACEQLPPPLALFHFDAAVNQGVTGAAQMLQQAVGVDTDGEIGPLTLAAIAARPIQQTLSVYAEIRRQRYRSLAQFWRFGKGWLKRVDATLALATSLNRASSPIAPTLQPKEKQPMPTDTSPATQPATDTDPKWWAHSMTIWGIVVTTLSTVLPALGPAFGLNITADLIHQLGDNVVVFGQAIGGLLGTILAIYGRVRASAPLERRQVTLNL